MGKPKMLGMLKPYTPNNKMDRKNVKTFIKKGKKK